MRTTSRAAAALSLALWLAAAAGAASVGSPVRAPTPAAVGRWAAAFESFLRSEDRDLSSVRAVLPLLSSLDPAEASVREALEPLSQRLQLAAEAVLAAPRDAQAPQPRLAEKLALLSQPLLWARLREDQRARVSEARERLREEDRARLERSAAALAKALAPDAERKEIVLAQILPEEGGRPETGRDQGEQIAALAERYAGRARVLSADGASSLFQSQFALEVDRSARDGLLRELRAIERLEAHPLAEIAAASARPADGEFLDATAFSALKDRLSKGSLIERLGAFAALGAALESAAPEQLAAIPPSLRDEALGGVHAVAAIAVNSFNLVSGDLRQRLRERAYFSSDAQELDHGAIEAEIARRLGAPELKAAARPLRELFVRAFAATERLDTEAARLQALQWLPHVEHAALEHVASSLELTRRITRYWLSAIGRSIEETLQGLRLGPERGEGWAGSGRSGGYEHLDGRRHSMHLYERRPYRADPDRIGHEALLLMGLREQPFPVGSLLGLLIELSQWRVPEMDALNRRNKIEPELEAALARLKAQLAEAGRELSPEQLDELRGQLRERLEAGYERHDHVDGHAVLDAALSALSRRPRFIGLAGFEPGLYIERALALLQELHAAIEEPGLLKQATDAAVGFLAELAGDPLLDERPALRAQAAQTWRAIAAKADARGLGLRTRLDGVIDPRPEIAPLDPKPLEGQGPRDWSAVWQTAESPDGRLLARASADRTVVVWEAATGRRVKTIRLEDARQYYGDLANSLGVAWAADGRLLVATLHDVEQAGVQKVRAFDLGDAKDELGPADALSEAVLPGVYVLRHMPRGAAGQFFAAGVELRAADRAYLGSELRLFALDGRPLATVPEAVLLDARGALALTAAPARQPPRLALWELSDPGLPRDVTPSWLGEWAEGWRARHPANEYGWWPELSAGLGAVGDSPALLIHDEGAVQVFELISGRRARALEIPPRWRAWSLVTDPAGRYAAALVAAPGGTQSQRVMVWELATGRIVMERRSEKLSSLLFGSGGKRLIAAGEGRVELFEWP